MRRWILRGFVALVVLFGLIQLVPFGRDHSNPPVTEEVKWDSPRARELAVDACYACHSNLTKWPAYATVAPISWLVQADVDGGREVLNFTEWDQPQEAELDEIVEIVREGEMPPWQYKALHPAGRLSSAEQDELASGLEQTLAADPPIAGGD